MRLTNNQGIRSFNRSFRVIDQATDVLSFPIGFDDPETGAFYLGDIVISLQMAQKQATQSNVTLQAELEMLMVHGILHLCGYDHDTPENYAMMSALQDDILQRVQNPLTGSIYAQ
ncbi:MAG TPA: rRNA maturation RNase YbeY [Anaerolineaceae bacterium]|nr:rRNA maturation RNase YbeY [Anaerolineaceae bacterium]